jgi:hypothetical protein
MTVEYCRSSGIFSYLLPLALCVDAVKLVGTSAIVVVVVLILNEKRSERVTSGVAGWVSWGRGRVDCRVSVPGYVPLGRTDNGHADSRKFPFSIGRDIQSDPLCRGPPLFDSLQDPLSCTFSLDTKTWGQRREADLDGQPTTNKGGGHLFPIGADPDCVLSRWRTHVTRPDHLS